MPQIKIIIISTYLLFITSLHFTLLYFASIRATRFRFDPEMLCWLSFFNDALGRVVACRQSLPQLSVFLDEWNILPEAFPEISLMVYQGLLYNLYSCVRWLYSTLTGLFWGYGASYFLIHCIYYESFSFSCYCWTIHVQPAL